MVDRYYNPFQGIDVSVPVEFHEDITRFSQRESRPIIDESPFPRMVDMWFLAVCIAARDGLKPVDLSKQETKKIIEGSIFSNDAGRVHMLMLIALAQSNDIEITMDPRKMMSIANGLAVAGLPKVIEMLKGEGDPIWNLSEAIENIVSKKKTA